jgi:hypothetical protein
MKATFDEFQGYVDAAKDCGGVEKGLGKLKVEDVEDEDQEDDDDDNYEDDDDDERDYSEEEVLVVEPAISIMKLSFDLSKSLLSLITTVADRIVADGNSVNVKTCQGVIALFVQCIFEIENGVVDLGAELYPPVSSDDEALIQFYHDLILSLKKTMACFKVESIWTQLSESERETLTTLDDRILQCKAY